MVGCIRIQIKVVSKKSLHVSNGKLYLQLPSPWNKEALAKEVLAEVPNQVVSWMTKRNIKPNLPNSQQSMQQ